MNRKTAILIASTLAAAALAGGLIYISSTKKDKETLSEEKKESLAGIGNPVAGMSKEDAYKKAEELGEGEDMGTWRTMSGEEFLTWWRDSNGLPLDGSGDDTALAGN